MPNPKSLLSIFPGYLFGLALGVAAAGFDLMYLASGGALLLVLAVVFGAASVVVLGIILRILL